MLVFTRYTVALNRLVVRASRKTPHPSWCAIHLNCGCKDSKKMEISKFLRINPQITNGNIILSFRIKRLYLCADLLPFPSTGTVGEMQLALSSDKPKTF